MKKISVPLLLLLVAAGLTAGVFATRQCARPPTTLDRIKDPAWLDQALDLSPEQEAQARALFATYADALSDCCGKMCGARSKLTSVLFTAPTDRTDEEAVLHEMAEAQMKSDRATIEHLRAVNAILTPDQQDKFRKLVTECLCASCGMCGGAE